VDSYTNALTIKTSPKKLYEAITTQKGLSAWWTRQVEIYPQIGGTGTFRFGKETYTVMKIAKIVPSKEVTWKCVEHHFKTPGTDKTDEWVGTTVRFSIKENNDDTTTLLFTHEGLVPKLYCYKDCKKGWDYYLDSLKRYLETGKGRPYKNR